MLNLDKIIQLKMEIENDRDKLQEIVKIIHDELVPYMNNYYVDLPMEINTKETNLAIWDINRENNITLHFEDEIGDYESDILDANVEFQTFFIDSIPVIIERIEKDSVEILNSIRNAIRKANNI